MTTHETVRTIVDEHLHKLGDALFFDIIGEINAVKKDNKAIETTLYYKCYECKLKESKLNVGDQELTAHNWIPIVEKKLQDTGVNDNDISDILNIMIIVIDMYYKQGVHKGEKVETEISERRLKDRVEKLTHPRKPMRE